MFNLKNKSVPVLDFLCATPPREITKKYSCGFTLAEVLITLVIIGVIAAITVPVMYAKHQKHQLAIRAKQTYSILQNGFKQALAKDGVDILSDTALVQSIAGDVITNGSGEQEFRKEFQKVFKVMAGKEKVDLNDDSVMNIKYKTLNGKATFSPILNWAEFNQIFYLANGSIAYIYLFKVPQGCNVSNEAIKQAGGHLYQPIGYVMFDTNGVKGPNQWGRDLFSTILGNDGNLYARASKDELICAAGRVDENYTWNSDTNANDYSCKSDNNTTTGAGYGQGCLSRLLDEGWEMNY